MSNNQITTVKAASEIDEIFRAKSTARDSESLVPLTHDHERKLIPRRQNKMVAEKTGDMFLGGLMCE